MKHMIMLFIFLSSTVQGLQDEKLETTKLIQCVLSARHHNRVLVENKKIKKVIYPERDVSIKIEEGSGQIFIQSMVDNPPNTTISIVTEDNFVQDLELSFTEKSSEIVHLSDSSDEILMESSLPICVEESEENSSIQFKVMSILSGKIPFEYVSHDDVSINCRVKNGVVLRSIARLESPADTIFIMLLENRSYCKKTIAEWEINIVQGSWIYLEKAILEKGEQSLVIIGVASS